VRDRPILRLIEGEYEGPSRRSFVLFRARGDVVVEAVFAPDEIGQRVKTATPEWELGWTTKADEA